jgi:molybdenum cofactor biosynthesis enzyme MoaA
MFPAVRTVRLTGGEPLMHERFGEIVRSVAKTGKGVAILTNGTRIIERWDEIPWGKIGTVNISITDTDRDEYLRITGTKLLDAVIEGVDKMAQRGLLPKRVFSFTMHRGNVRRAAEFVMFAHEHRAHSVTLQQLVPHGVPGKDAYETDAFWNRALVLQDEKAMAELAEQRAIVERKLGKLKSAAFVKWPFVVDLHGQGRPCAVATRMLFVDGAGDIALCCNGKGPRSEMGNVIKDGAKAFSTGPMAELRARIYDVSKPKLRKCELCFASYSGRD